MTRPATHSPDWPTLHSQIEGVAFQLRLTDPARQYLWKCINDGPSRKVMGRLGNAVFDFHSRKMDMRLKLESRRGEHVHAILLEQDPSVIAYFAQPPSVVLDIKDENGITKNTVNYTPDMLIVRKNEIVIAETRDDDRLFTAMERNPYQFYKDASHRWRYRAAEVLFEAMGFRYELIGNSSLPAILVENMRFLEDYCHEECPPLVDAVAAAIADRVSTQRHVSLGALLDDGFSADAVFKCIADRRVYVDLHTDRLACTQELTIYADEHTRRAAQAIKAANQEPHLPIPGTYVLKPNSKVRFDGKTYVVAICGERDVVLVDEMGTQFSHSVAMILNGHKQGIIELDECAPGASDLSIADVDPAELQRAMAKLDAVRIGGSDAYSERSLSRFRQAIEHANNDMEAILALVDNRSGRGNREPRVSKVNQALIEQAITKHYNDERNTNRKGAWDKYVGLCKSAVEDNGQPVRAVSYPTFCRYANDLASTKARKGKRAAYQEAPIQQALESCFPTHGIRPHEICYVDHTIANIALISPGGNDLGKPTLTLAIDGHTAQTRAQYVSFDPPSTAAVLMVLRDYVRRHNRLPRVLSVDNGSDFRSRGLSSFCKLYGIELRFRAPGQPRGGAMIERLLGATEDEVLSELKGNTRILRTDARLVTKTVNPFNHAAWTLPALYKLLDQYLFIERPGRIHPVLGTTPNDYEKRRLHETGYREFKGVRFDETIMLLTCPHAKRPFHKVDPQRGVWVDGMWYQHSELRKVRHGQKVEVRVEPWNASIVYVQAGKRWVAAIGNNRRWLYRRTHREMEMALRAESSRANRDAGRDRTNPESRKHRHEVWRPEDFDHRLAMQQSEMRYPYDQQSMTLALPSQVPPEIDKADPEVMKPQQEIVPPSADSPQESQPWDQWPESKPLEQAFAPALPPMESPPNDDTRERPDTGVEVYEPVDMPTPPNRGARPVSLLQKIGRFR
jgi:putative transposase